MKTVFFKSEANIIQLRVQEITRTKVKIMLKQHKNKTPRTHSQHLVNAYVDQIVPNSDHLPPLDWTIVTILHTTYPLGMFP